MTERCDVCIHGRGIVGMSLALELAASGISIALRAPTANNGTREPGDDVRTYALNAASIELLQRLGIWPQLDADAATPVYEMHIEGDSEGAALEFSAYDFGRRELAWIVDAQAIESALAEVLQTTAAIVQLDAAADVDADLLVFADGRQSAGHGAEVRRRDYGQHALAVRLVADRPHNGRAWQRLESPAVLALLPFARPEAGRSYGLVWSLPSARAQQLLEIGAAEFEAALIEATGGAAGALKLASKRALWPLVFARAEPVCGKGWVMVGDAAHVVHPLAGQGLNLGLADVETLARVLTAREPGRSVGDLRLLRRYAGERALPTRAMGAMTDGLWQLFASEAPGLKELRRHGLNLVDRLPMLKRWLAAQAMQH